ncbi:hypothetical protein C8Q79DRAFT_785752 [Trametes meyenii]|nr:hypothetical protein C8Q79DRAFT_785752 [Trametes meyenii]
MKAVLALLQRVYHLHVGPDLSVRVTRCTDMASPATKDVQECLVWCKEYVEASRVRKVLFRSTWRKHFAAAFTRFLMRKTELLELFNRGQAPSQTVGTTDSEDEKTTLANMERFYESMDSRVDQFVALFESDLSPEEQSIAETITLAGGEREVLQDHDSLLELVSPIDTLTFSVDISVHIDFAYHFSENYYSAETSCWQPASYSISRTMKPFRQVTSPEILSAVGGVVEAVAQMIPDLLKTLEVVAEVHPFTKLAVAAFNVAHDMYKKQKDNNKRITVLHVEMSYMMDELRILENTDSQGVVDSIKDKLQKLCQDAEQDIKSCSNACVEYAQKSRAHKYVLSPAWEAKLTGYIKTFRERKKDFSRATVNLVKFGVDNIRAELKAGVDEIKASGDDVNASLDEIKSTLKDQAVSMDAISAHLQSLAGSMQLRPTLPPPVALEWLEDFTLWERTVANADDSHSDDEEKPMPDAQRVGELDADFRRQQQAWMEYSLDARLNATSTESLHQRWAASGRLIAIYMPPAARARPQVAVLTDEDFRRLWEQMRWGLSKPAIHFARTVKEYFREKALRAKELSSEDGWAIQWLVDASAQSIAETVDEDCSGLVSLEEVNRLSQNKPVSWSLVQWLTFKVLAWQSIAKMSVDMINALLDKMFTLRSDFEDSPETLSGIDLYLHAVWSRIFLLVRSFDPRTAPDLESIPEDRRRRVRAEFQLLRDKLAVVRFHLPSVDSVNDVLGTERIETRVLPLIAVLLERHYAIMQLAATVSLHPEELSVAANSILCVLDVMDTRHKSLTVLLKHADEDVAKRIGQYACGLFNYLHNPSAAWSRQAFHKIAIITSKELEVKPTPAHPEDLLHYAHGKPAKGRTTGKARYPTVHLDTKCDSCSRDVVGARTVCMECGTDVTKTVNFCSIPRCRNTEVSVDTRPDLGAPHLLSHAVFRFEPQLHLRDFGRVDLQARKALEAAKKTLRADNEPPCFYCGRPTRAPCWACITCPDVFLCEDCELRRTNEHSATHGLVKCQDEQAAAERRTKAMENNLLAMNKRMTTMEERMSAMEEGLRAHLDGMDRRMEHMTELLEKVAARRSSKK